MIKFAFGKVMRACDAQLHDPGPRTRLLLDPAWAGALLLAKYERAILL